MELVLVRHGEPQWVKDGRNVDNPQLSELGHRQAASTAAVLGRESFDEVLVSPLDRAQQTAAPIIEALGVEATTTGWLEEIQNPEWEGTDHDVQRIFSDARRRPAEAQWEGLPGGESFRQFHVRIVAGLTTLLSRNGVTARDGDLPRWDVADPQRRILVVAHAGTNSVILAHLLGVVPVPWEWERFVLYHASISRTQPLVIADGYSFGLMRLSDTCHLGEMLTF